MKAIMAVLLTAATILIGGGARFAPEPAAAHIPSGTSFRDNYWFALEHCGTRGGLHGIIYVCALHKPATLYIGGPGAGRGGHLKMTSLRWSRWNGGGAYGRGALWLRGPNWRREGAATIRLYRARQFFMSTGYYTRIYLAPQFRVNHSWRWTWYGSFPRMSGKWVVGYGPVERRLRQSPVAPSVCSLRMSACPMCRACSLMMCT